LNTSSKVVSISQIEDFKDKIDVMILCRGSAKDLPEQVVMISKISPDLKLVSPWEL
jgi:diaminopimelate dehydrogenase